jgi:hypothetical protein
MQSLNPDNSAPSARSDEGRGYRYRSVDHAADETRYACMARPWLKAPSLEERIKALPIDYVQKQESIAANEWEKHWKAYL